MSKNFTRQHTPKRAYEYKKTMTGTVQGNQRGFAFITPDNGGRDFFVPKRALNGAYHGDRVEFAHVPNTEDEAVILKIIARSPQKIVGTLVFDRRAARVYPDDSRQPLLYIPRELTYGAESGQKVLCEVTSYPKDRTPGGRVVEILGDEGELFAEELSIIRAHNLREQFPNEVIFEARTAAEEKVVLNGRRDLRNKLIFTIDGEDTRDIDDAISLEMEGGNFVLGVHIADVAHYVKFKGDLDNEAYARGTSVYFPDRVLPMLPEELSNGACSLNEGEDRYAMSCVMTFDRSGERVNYEIFESVIKSHRKTSYPEMAAVCEGDGAMREKHADIAQTLDKMKELCLLLEKRREQSGAVTLDVKEAHIYLNDDGKIVIPPAERSISQRIIEQFMIAANEAVSEFLASKNAPCLYRVHEKPAPEKAESFFVFLKELGVTARGTPSDIHPKDFQTILNSVADKPCYGIVNRVMLRSMQKARYCGDNLGHFGLASTSYCHFTSPIRRYPDLFVHRSLKEVLHGSPERARKLYAKLLSDAGRECSDRERIADEAERNVDDLYKLAYMSDHIGEEFDGVISGVTAFGVFCELDNTVEGLIPIEDLPEDAYEFFEEKLLLKGRKRRFRIGDSLRVTVTACDLGRMKVLFRVANL